MMRFLISLLCLFTTFTSVAQDFSNKGKDFWLCFPSHVPNTKFDAIFYAKMSLFITSDKASSGKVSIPNVFTVSFTVVPGVATEIDVPYNLAYIKTTEAGSVLSKGIQVKVDGGKPAVVVYAQLYAGFRSAASLVLPSNVLGKKYFSMNAPQAQSIPDEKSQFVVVAVDTNTTVQIIPMRNGIKGAPFSIVLPIPGDVYEFQDDNDLTGSVIESIANGVEGCKRIAVFSGSSAIAIRTKTNCDQLESYDPLYQQLYPVTSWGKTYGFVPFEKYTKGNPFRIMAAENNTNVTINGLPVATLNEGQFYPDNNQFGITLSSSVIINGDKPISVAQYAQQSGCSGATPPPDQGYGDPDMVMLNPIEQNVNNITVFSSPKENIYSDSKFINVLIKDQATASFTINGSNPAALWSPIAPAGSGYSYAKINLASGQSSFTLKADSNFNAIAYGFGDYESYAYSAGTNVKDLYRVLKIENESGNAEFPIGCKDASFKISITFPYQPTKIKVAFNGLFPDEVLVNPVPVETFLVNGKIVYRYRLTQTYKVNKVGSFPITVVVDNAAFNACGIGQDEIDFDLEIVERPKADFSFISDGCINNVIAFKDNTNGYTREVKQWFYNFDDGFSSNLALDKHSYPTAGDYVVKHWTINDIGCTSDTIQKQVPITNIPLADFTKPLVACEKDEVLFSNQSSVSGTGSLVKFNWDFGDQVQVLATNGNPIKHSYAATGAYTASLQVETGSGCKSLPVKQEVEVNATPSAGFSIPNFCLPVGSGQFINQSAISDGTTTSLSYVWDFGDGTSMATDKDPVHQYKTNAPFSVKLLATSAKGCQQEVSAAVSSIYDHASLVAGSPMENCFGTVSNVVVPTEFGNKKLGSIYFAEDNTTSFTKTVLPTLGTAFLKAINFSTSGKYTVMVFGEIENSGCYTDTATKIIYVNALPNPGFKVATALCDQKPISFIDTSTSMDGRITKWKWNVSNGGMSVLQNPELTLPTGTYSITLATETEKGCTAETEAMQITVTDNPIPDFSLPDICVSDGSATFKNACTIVNNTNNSLQYSWTFDDPTANNSNPNTSTDKDPTHIYTKAGEYKVDLAAVSLNGCRADKTKLFTVNSSKPLAGFTMNAINICSDKQLTIKDASSIDIGRLIKLEIYWDYAKDPTNKTIDNFPALGKSYTHQYAQAAGRDTQYTVKYVVHSGQTCLDEMTQTVTIKPLPDIKFDALPGVCEEIKAFKIIAGEKNNLPGKGVFTGTIAADGLFTPLIAKAGTHTLAYTFTSVDGCINTATQNMTVFPTPYANAGQDKQMEKGDVITLDGKGRGNAIQYNWTPFIAMDNATMPTPKVSPKEDIMYKLTVMSSDGCIATDEVDIKVLKDIFVPTAFTPNNDGKNDQWAIPYLSFYKDCIVQVYNRYGQLLFYSEGYSKPWDGRYKGVEQPTGTYVWQIKLKKNSKPMVGQVTLIR